MYYSFDDRSSDVLMHSFLLIYVVGIYSVQFHMCLIQFLIGIQVCYL